MSFPDFLRSMFADSGKARNRPAKSQPKRAPLRVEELEDRVTPSGFHGPTPFVPSPPPPPPGPPPGPPPAPVFPTTPPSLGTIGAAPNVVVNDPASAAALTITELGTGTYQFTLADTQGTSTVIRTGVANITVNFTNNVGQTDSVTLNHNAGGPLTGALAINDNGTPLANLQVTGNTGFDVTGAVTVSANGAGASVNVTSTSENLGSVATTTGAATSFGKASSVSLTGDVISNAAGVAINIGAGAGQNNTVSLVNDTITGAGGATVIQRGATAATLSTTVTNTTINNATGDLTVTQTGGTNALVTVNGNTTIRRDLTVTNQGVTNSATASVTNASVGRNLSITQHGGNSNLITLANLGVTGNITTLTQQTLGTNTINIDDTSVGGTTNIAQTPFGAGGNLANAINIGSTAAGFPGVVFTGTVTSNQGLAGSNIDQLGATELVRFVAAANTFNLNPAALDEVFKHVLRVIGNVTINPASAEQDVLT